MCIKLAVFADQSWRHLGVAKHMLPGKTLLLELPDFYYALADFGGSFAAVLRRKLTDFHRRNIDVNVYAIQQRAGNFRNIPLNLRRRAATFAGRIAIKPAVA